ncbi:MAG: hypothetical protein FJ134_11215 [Deltaproteobacteria bacterium]|nr:hypothetical protein [Deltaproteobacteria bacterium]
MLRKSLTIPIIAIFTAIACGTLFLGYFINISSLKDALETREADKANHINFIISSIIDDDIKRLSELSKVLRENLELVQALARYYESPDTLGSLHRLLDNWNSQLEVDMFDLTDRRGVEIYCCARCPVEERGCPGWGVEEALAGKP